MGKIREDHEMSWNITSCRVVGSQGEREYKNSLPLWRFNLGSTRHQMAKPRLPTARFRGSNADVRRHWFQSPCPVKWAIRLGCGWANGFHNECLQKPWYTNGWSLLASGSTCSSSSFLPAIWSWLCILCQATHELVLCCGLTCFDTSFESPNAF